MATIDSGTWDTSRRPRSQYKIYDIEVYELQMLHRFTMNGVAKMALNNPTGIINRWINSDNRGQYLKDMIKEPEVVWQTLPEKLTVEVGIMAYIQSEDYVAYKLMFGVDECM